MNRKKVILLNADLFKGIIIITILLLSFVSKLPQMRSPLKNKTIIKLLCGHFCDHSEVNLQWQLSSLVIAVCLGSESK